MCVIDIFIVIGEESIEFVNCLMNRLVVWMQQWELEICVVDLWCVVVVYEVNEDEGLFVEV